MYLCEPLHTEEEGRRVSQGDMSGRREEMRIVGEEEEGLQGS